MSTVFIAPPMAADRQLFLEAVARSTSLHASWVSPPATATAFDEFVSRAARGDCAKFLVRLRDDTALAGAVNISNIVRESLSSAFLGFYAFEPHANQGFMKAGLRLVLARAFGDLALHRVEANIQPENHASIALVRACAFRKEGFSPKYLHVAGQWRDHERWALLADEFQSPQNS